MALVGHISGSKQSNSVIGISGSVIVANRPQATFPALPGSDVKFYVEQLSLFGSEGIVSSGSLAVKDSSGVSRFSVSPSTGNTSVGGTLSAAGVSNLNSGLYVAGAAGLSGSLNVAGNTSLAGTLVSTGVANLNGGLYVAGSTGLSGSLALSAGFTASGVTNLNGGLYVAGSTGVSGSLATNSTLTASGIANLNSGLYVVGDTGLSGSLAASGATTLASTLNVTGNVAINTDKFTITAATGAVSGSSTAAFGPTLANGSLTVTATGGTGNGTFAGDVAVNGGDLTTTSTSATLFNTGATSLAIGSAATSVLLGATSGVGTTTVQNNLVVTKDLTVNGTMTTVNTTNLEIKDAVIGLGFASGSAQQTAGDRGWIGGLLGANNVMNKWDNTFSEFAFARTTSSSTGSFSIASYADLHANNIQGNIVSASLGFSGSLTKLIDGTSAFIAGTNISITSASNGAVTISTSAGAGDVVGPASSTGDAVALFNGTTGKLLKNSSITTADGGSSLFVASKLGVSGSLTSAGVANLNGGLYVLGSAGISGSLSTSDGLTVTGVSNLNGGLYVVGSTGLSGSLDMSGTATVTGVTNLNGGLYVAGSMGLSGSLTVTGDILPSADVTYNLGSADNRWAHIYTGDLHLRNDRGDYTLIEEEDFLSIRFNKTGKRYKFVLEAVPQFDEEPALKF